MPSPLKPSSSSKQYQQRHGDASLLRNFMDRKHHNLNFLYTYPPYPYTPAAFSVNGVTYVAQPAAGQGSETVGMNVPTFNLFTTDPRSIPNLHRQGAAQAQQEASASRHSSAATAAAAAAGQSRDPSPSGTAASNDNNTILIPSRPSSPITVQAAIHCLAGQVHDAIRLCTKHLAAHNKVIEEAKFVSEATRNAMWRDLLEHKLRAGGFAQDGFHNLGRRLDFYMEAAYRAAAMGEEQSGEARRKADERLMRLQFLRTQCKQVVKLAEGGARDNAEDCVMMLKWMKEMRDKLRSGARGESKQSQHGENGYDGAEEGDTSGETGMTGLWE